MTVLLRRLFVRSIAWQLFFGLSLFIATPSLRAGSSLAALDAFHVGRYHLANGHRDQALEAFNDAVRMNPQLVPAYIARGKLLAEMGRFDSALADLNFALRLQPTHAEGFAYRGYALLSMGKAQEAMPEFDMALRLDPTYARVHYLRGQSLKLLGNELAAEASLATALRLDPSIETTQVITASAEAAGDSNGPVRLAGPTALERSSTIADTAVPPAPKLPAADQGRLLRFDRHPLLAKLQSPSEMHGRVSPPGPYRQTLADPNNPLSIANRYPARPSHGAHQVPQTTAERPAPGSKLSSAESNRSTVGRLPTDAIMPEDSELVASAKIQNISPDGFPIVGGISMEEPAPAARSIFDGTASPDLPAKPSEEESNRRVSAALEVAKQAVAENADAPPSAEHPAGVIVASDRPELTLPQGIAADEPASLAAAPLPIAPEPQEIPLGGLPTTAAACRTQGLASEESGRQAEAGSAYDEAVRLDPNDPQNFCLRGHLHRKEGRFDEATADFENAIRLAPGLAIGYYGRGMSAFDRKQFVEAIDDFNITVRLDDAHAEALLKRSSCFAALGRKSEADADRLAALALDPSLAKAGSNDAAAVEQAVASNSPAYTFAEATAIASDAPTSAEAASRDVPAPLVNSNEGGALQGTPTDQEAASAEAELELQRLNEELVKTPGDADLYRRRAQLHLSQGDAEEALDDLQAAFRIQPENVDALRLRVEAHLALSRLPAAQEDLSELLRLDPNDAGLLAERGSVRLALGMTEEAKDDLTQAIALDDDCAAAYCRRGLALVLVGESERAMADFAAAIERDPNAAENFLYRAKAFIEFNRATEAMADLNRAIELDPNCAEAYFERSRLYAQRRAFEKSQSDRRRALELDPTLR